MADSGRQWQQPAVDVLKDLEVNASSKCQVKGVVTPIEVQANGKAVHRVRSQGGDESYVQFPKYPSQSLGLVGRYLCLRIRTCGTARRVSFQVDVLTNSRETVRVSFSTDYKEFKGSSNWIQYPLSALSREHWTVLSVDLKHLVASYANSEYLCLKNIRMCGDMDLAALLSTDQTSGDAFLHNARLFPATERIDHVRLPMEGATVTPDRTEVEKTRLKPKAWRPSLVDRAVKKVTTPAQGTSGVLDKYAHTRVHTMGQHPSSHHVQNEQDVLEPNDMGRRRLARHIAPPQQDPVRLSPLPGSERPVTSTIAQARNYDHEVHGNIEATRIVGLNILPTSSVLFSSDAQQCVFSSEALIVIMRVASNSQTLLKGHTSRVTALAMAGNDSLLASSEEGPNPGGVWLWDMTEKACLTIIPHQFSANTLSFSYFGALLLSVSRHPGAKNVVTLWDTTQALSSPDISAVCRQHSDADIGVFKISPARDNRLVSCGRDNIRIWRVKDGQFHSSAVDLGEFHDSTVHFLDLDFLCGADSSLRAFVAASNGYVFEVSCDTFRLERVHRAHEGPVHSIVVAPHFCVTGGTNGIVHGWPHDFKESFLEAVLASPVVSVKPSENFTTMAIATADASFGVLDIEQKHFVYLQQSHRQEILSISIDEGNNRFATASRDGTIRIWSLACVQEYQYSAGATIPTCVSLRASRVACTFEDGWVHLLSLADSAETLHIHKHETAAEVTYLVDNNKLVTANRETTASHSILSLFDLTQKPAVSIMAHRLNPVNGRPMVAYDQSSNRIAAVNLSSIVVFSGATLDKFQISGPEMGSPFSMQFHPARDELLIGTDRGLILRVDVADGTVLHRSKMADQAVGPLQIMAQGDLVVFGVGQTIQVAKTQGSSILHRATNHLSPVTALAVYSDRVLSGGTALLASRIVAAKPSAQSHATSETTESPRFTTCFDVSESEGSEPPRENVPQPLKLHDLSHELMTSTRDVTFEMPSTLAHYTGPRLARLPEELFTPAPGDAGMVPVSVLGISGSVKNTCIWHPSTGLFAFISDCFLVQEDLESHSQQLNKHGSQITCLTAAADGSVIATASVPTSEDDHCTIRVIDATTWKTIEAGAGHDGPVHVMKFSAGNRYLLTVGNYRDNAVILWRTKGLKLVLRIPAKQPVNDVAWDSQRPNRYVTVGQKGYISFWKLTEAKGTIEVKGKRGKYEGLAADFTCVTYSPEQRLLVGDSTGCVHIFDSKTKGRLDVVQAQLGDLVVLQALGNRILAGGSDGRLRLVDMFTDRLVVNKELNLQGPISCACFDAIGAMGTAATGSAIWYTEWESKQALRLVGAHSSQVCSVACSSGKLLVTGGVEGDVWLWNRETNEQVVHFQTKSKAACNCVAFSPNGELCVAGYQDAVVRVFDVQSLEMVARFTHYEAAVTQVAYSADGTVLIAGTSSGSLSISNAKTGHCVASPDDHIGAPITSLSVLGLNSSELWTAASGDRRVSVWESRWSHNSSCSLIDWLSFPAPSFVPTDDCPTRPPCIARICPTNADLVVYTGYSQQPEILIWSLSEHGIVRRLPMRFYASALDLCPAGNMIAVATPTRLLSLYDFETGAFQDFVGHSSTSQELCFSGNTLYSIGGETLVAWSLAGEEAD